MRDMSWFCSAMRLLIFAAMILVANMSVSFAYVDNAVSDFGEGFELGDEPTLTGNEGLSYHYHDELNDAGCFGMICGGLASVPAFTLTAFATKGGYELSWFDHAFLDRALCPPRRPPRLFG